MDTNDISACERLVMKVINRGSGITGYHEQSKSGERKKLEATDGFYFSGKTG